MSGNPAPGFRDRPEHAITLEPMAATVRVVFAGRTVAESARALLVRETGYRPVLYFPHADVRLDLAEPGERRTYCPFKGEARYWSLAADGRRAEDAIWSYETPYDEMHALAGHCAFYWDRVDAWYADGERLTAPPS